MQGDVLTLNKKINYIVTSVKKSTYRPENRLHRICHAEIQSFTVPQDLCDIVLQLLLLKEIAILCYLDTELQDACAAKRGTEPKAVRALTWCPLREC